MAFQTGSKLYASATIEIEHNVARHGDGGGALLASGSSFVHEGEMLLRANEVSHPAIFVLLCFCTSFDQLAGLLLLLGRRRVPGVARSFLLLPCEA